MNRPHHPLEGRNNAAVLCGGVVPPLSLLRHPQFGRPHRVASPMPMDPSPATASIHPFRSRSRSSFRKMNHSAPPSTPFLSRSLSWVSNYISGERASEGEEGLSLFLCVGRDRRRCFRGMPNMVSERAGERGVDCACPRDEADDARVIRAATSASPLPPPPAAAARVVGQ